MVKSINHRRLFKYPRYAGADPGKEKRNLQSKTIK